MKTATLERFAVFGTSRHLQRLTYRGKTLNWRIDGQGAAYAQAPCRGQETLAAMLATARRAGFDRVKFAGDWDRITVRRTVRTGGAA